VELKRELESKDAEIERLKAQNEETEHFYKDRIRTIEARIETNDLAGRIKHGETANLEFKSNLRWNIYMNGFDKEIENACLKTIVAFCNSNGGDLLIGIADDGTILGIEHDGFRDTDRFQLHLGNLLQDRVVPTVAHLVEYKTLTLGGKSVCQVTRKRSSKEVWLKPDKNSQEHFFVRSGPSSRELSPRETVDYIRDHFKRRAH
jgi:predicted HTH transcriptional regulator